MIKEYSVLMFVKLIKEFIKFENIIDFYERIIIKPGNVPDAVLSRHLNWTFKDGKVFKIPLNSISIERLHKEYLFFSNDMEAGEHRFKFIMFDEFIKNIPRKSSYKIYKDIEDNFFTKNYTANYLLKSLIIIEEYLTYDEKYINIYCNEVCKRHLLKMINNNTVKWFKPSEDATLQAIRRMGRRTKTEWEEEQENNPTNNYNQNWETETTIEDFLPCDTTEDKIKYKYKIDRLI